MKIGEVGCKSQATGKSAISGEVWSGASCGGSDTQVSGKGGRKLVYLSAKSTGLGSVWMGWDGTSGMGWCFRTWKRRSVD